MGATGFTTALGGAAEWITSAMTLIQIGGRSLAICEDDERARYVSVDRIAEARPSRAMEGESPHSVRLLIDLQRNFGGLAPRALLGGQFSAQPGNDTTYEVLVGGDFNALSAIRDQQVDIRLLEGAHRGWPLIPGLPHEFAPATLRGLTDDEWCDVELPSGILVVDRAGFDEQGSSAVIFELAGKMLRSLLAVNLSGGDIRAEAHRLIQFW